MRKNERKSVAQVNFAGGGGPTNWVDIVGKPLTFPPDTHSHPDVIAAGASGFMTGTDKTKLNGIASGATANSPDATLLNRANHTGTQDAATITGSKTSSFISDFVSAVNALITAASTSLLARANHTGTQLASTISDFSSAVAALITGKQDTLISGTNIKTINGNSLLGSGDLTISGGGGGGVSPAIKWII